MTPGEFRATRKHVDDLGAYIDTDDLKGVAGYVYTFDESRFYIEGPDKRGAYVTTIDRSIYAGPDLGELEILLYAWVGQNYGNW